MLFVMHSSHQLQKARTSKFSVGTQQRWSNKFPRAQPLLYHPGCVTILNASVMEATNAQMKSQSALSLRAWEPELICLVCHHCSLIILQVICLLIRCKNHLGMPNNLGIFSQEQRIFQKATGDWCQNSLLFQTSYSEHVCQSFPSLPMGLFYLYLHSIALCLFSFYIAAQTFSCLVKLFVIIPAFCAYNIILQTYRNRSKNFIIGNTHIHLRHQL